MEEFLRAVAALDITVIQLNVIIPETLSHYGGQMECLKVKMED